jgi:hypothetical protein
VSFVGESPREYESPDDFEDTDEREPFTLAAVNQRLASLGGRLPRRGGSTVTAACLTREGSSSDPGAMFVNQTAVSAVLVIALHRTGTGSERLIDALIGGGVALTMAVLLFPAAPLPLIRDATQAVFAALGEALDHLGEVLAGQTHPDAAWTLSTGQHIHGRLATLTDAHSTAVRIVGLAPRRWRDRMPVRRAEAHWGELNLLAGTVLSLLRVATTAVRADVAVPSGLREAIGDLAAALNVLAGRGPADVSDSIATANHAAELIDNRPLSTEGYLAFIGLLTRAGAADLCRAVDLDPTTDK